MKLKRLLLMAIIGVTFGCSNDDGDANNNDCETENFGYFKASIPSSEYRTAFTFTEVGEGSPVDYIIDPNKTTDTFDVPAGLYAVSAAQINDQGLAVSESVEYTTNLLIEACETTTRTVEFEN